VHDSRLPDRARLWSRPVNRNTVLWTLVVFFGASIMFAAVRDATRDEGAGVSLLAQLGAGALLVGAIVIYMKRRG
jgi:hypothetical protein